jgi:hypothetical protein
MNLGEIRDQAAAYFDRMGIPQECDACGSGDWTVAEVGQQTMVLGGASFQDVRIYCNNCGRMMFYDLKKIRQG